MISRFQSCAKKWTLSAATGMFFLSSGAVYGQAPPTSAAPYTPQRTLQNAVQRELNSLNSAEPQQFSPVAQQQAQSAEKKRFFLFGGSSSTHPNQRTGLRQSRTRPGSRRSTARTPQITPAQPRSNPVQQVQYAPAAPQRRVAPKQNSAVMDELHKLYRAEGRPIPQMNVPNYQRPAINQAAAQQVRSQKKPGLMSKIFPFMKKKKPVAQQASQQVSPAAPAQIQPQTAIDQIPPAPAPAPAPIAIEPIQALEEIPNVSGIAPAPLPSDDLENPFTEESENEADGVDVNPFGAIALEEETDTEEPATAEEPTEAPNPFEVLAENEDDLAPARILPAEPAQEEAKPEAHTQKLQQIAERKGLNGLKGFCIVSLRDERELIDTDSEFSSIHGLKTYYFATADAKSKFDAEPEKYAPASDGHDVVVLTDSSEEVEGTLDHAAWYRGKLYLFSSAESKTKFHNTPADYLQQSPIEQVKLEEEQLTIEAEEE